MAHPWPTTIPVPIRNRQQFRDHSWRRAVNAIGGAILIIPTAWAIRILEYSMVEVSHFCATGLPPPDY